MALGCMLLFKAALLHTTLSAEDTTALYLFASRNIIPVTRVENKTTRTFQKLYAGVADWGKPAGAILDPSAWSMAAGPEQQGFLFCDHCGSQTEGRAMTSGGCPEVYLDDGEPARLVVWQTQGLLVRQPPPRVHCVQRAHTTVVWAADWID
jgi:hypothetical protein